MKTRLFLLIALLLGMCAIAYSQTVGDYRTVISGNWNVLSSWQRYNGAVIGWVTPTAAPTNTNASVITIRSGHTVTVTTGVNVDQVVVEASAQISINSGVTMVLANNLAYNPDMTVNGVVRNAGTLTSTGTLTFAMGSKYQHNWTNGDTGTIPKAIWDDGSTCEIIGFTSGITPIKLQGTSQSFYDFKWNCPAQLQTVYIRGDSFRPVRNNFLMQSTGTSNCEVTAVSPGRLELTNYVQSGGIFTISSGAVGYTVNIGGDVSITGGTLTTGATASLVCFNKNGTQTFSNTGGLITNYVDFIVKNSSTLDLGYSVLTGNGTFTMDPGSGLMTANADGITLTSAAGSVQVRGARTYSAESDYTYNGTVAQVTGDGLITANNFTINNPAALTLSNSTTVNGVLYHVSGAITGSLHTDGYSAEAYNYINIAESDDIINDFAISMTTPNSLPQYVNRKWTVFGNYSAEKTVTFYWTVADDNGFNWADFTPAVWKNGVSYLASSYEVTGEIRYITVNIPASLTRGEYVIGQVNGTLPNIRVYAEEPIYYTSTSDVLIPVMVEGIDQNIRGFALDISFDPTYLNIHDLLDLSESTFLSGNGLTQWYASGSNGHYNVTCALMGVTPGSLGSGTLFALNLTPQGASTGAEGTNVELSNIVFRDVMNQPVYAGTIENTNVVIDVTPVYVNFKVFLQGPYVTGGSMTHALHNNVPLVSPYNAQVITALPNVLPYNIVDWVFVQLRTGTANSSMVQSANAFLLDNGGLVDVLGNSSLPFFETAGNQYYIVVKHRNHLAIMSAVRYSLSNNPTTPTTINLSVPGSAYGANNVGFKLMQAGIYAMYSGDADRNGRIANSDSNNYWRLQTGQSGYKAADFNLNGIVQNSDKNNYFRLNNGKQTLVP